VRKTERGSIKRVRASLSRGNSDGISMGKMKEFTNERVDGSYLRPEEEGFRGYIENVNPAPPYLQKKEGTTFVD